MSSYDDDDIEIVHMPQDHKGFHQPDYGDSDQLLVGNVSSIPRVEKGKLHINDIEMYSSNRSASDFEDSASSHESHKLWGHVERVRGLLRTTFFVLPILSIVLALAGFVFLIHSTIRDDDSSQGALIGITATCLSISLLAIFVSIGVWRRKSLLDLVMARKQGQTPNGRDDMLDWTLSGEELTHFYQIKDGTDNPKTSRKQSGEGVLHFIISPEGVYLGNLWNTEAFDGMTKLKQLKLVGAKVGQTHYRSLFLHFEFLGILSSKIWVLIPDSVSSASLNHIYNVMLASCVGGIDPSQSRDSIVMDEEGGHND